MQILTTTQLATILAAAINNSLTDAKIIELSDADVQQIKVAVTTLQALVPA